MTEDQLPGAHNNGPGQPKHHAVNDERVRKITRTFIVNHLRREGFGELADQLTTEESISSPTYDAIERIVRQLEEERAQQFVDILNSLRINRSNIRITYRTIVNEIFSDGVNWGRIVAFLLFSAQLATYCAQNSMSVQDVVEWTETEMATRVQQWMESQGGWEACVRHFNEDPSWSVDWPTVVLSAGMVVALITAGVFTIKKFFF